MPKDPIVFCNWCGTRDIDPSISDEKPYYCSFDCRATVVYYKRRLDIAMSDKQEHIENGDVNYKGAGLSLPQ